MLVVAIAVAGVVVLQYKSKVGLRRRAEAEKAPAEESFFWDTIEASRMGISDWEEQLTQLENLLMALRAPQVRALWNRLQLYKEEAAHQHTIAAARIIDPHAGTKEVGSFLAWLVGQGRKTYNLAREEADYLAQLDEEQMMVEWEGLEPIFTNTYRRMEREELIPPYIPTEEAVTETDRKDLKELCPRLWAQYREK